MVMFMNFLTLAALLGFTPTLAETNAEEQLPEIYKSFHKAFGEEGYTEEQIDKILLNYYSEGIDMTRWPFTDCGKELVLSAKNPANGNSAKIIEAITGAGGNPDNLASLSSKVCAEAHKLLAKKGKASTSLLELEASAGDAATIYLGRAISMTSGSVASNTAAINGLTSTVAQNTVNIQGLSMAVSSLSTVTQPTAILAESLGLPVATVASASLAGSFLGPLLGVIAIVYASWPEEEIDPWLKVESRVAEMISEKFNLARRKRLGDRIRRYVKQFARCSQAWVSDGLVKFHGLSLPKHIVDEAKMITGQSSGIVVDVDKTAERFPAPPCTAQLEGHMSLERDEWFRTDNGQMSALFMPFANMHTQLLSMLTDHPFDDKMNWGDALQTTAAEYGNYMLSHLVSSWKAQACRTIRLRHSMQNLYYRYQFVVLKPVYQPHAGDDCSKHCASESGWCDWCGGKNVGACCKKGDGGVCSRFDVPVGYYLGKYNVCVHADCVQSNTMYSGQILEKFGLKDNGAPRTVDECQHLCQNVQGAVAFSLLEGGKKCTCNGEKDIKRYQSPGSSSGPVSCKESANSIAQEEEEFEDKLNETATVPMEEVKPCSEKSEAVRNIEQLESEHLHWVETCSADATKVAVQEYNVFYKRFAEFVDMLTWKAGCGAQHQYDWSFNAKDGDGMEKVSDAFDGGSFGDCNWDREEQLDKNIKWVFDEERARGWTKTSRVNMEEQGKMKTKFAMPSWLHDLRNVQDCLKKTAAGNVNNVNSRVSTSVDQAMGPASIDEGSVQTNQDGEYDRLLQEALGR